MSTPLKIAAAGAAVAAILGSAAWYTHAPRRIQSPQALATPSVSRGAKVASAEQLASPARPHPPPLPALTEDLAASFKHATDYAEFARRIRGDAESGKPDAQYYLEEALRYCEQNLTGYFGLGSKHPQTVDQVQARWASYHTRNPEMRQQEILDIYARCHAFLDDPAVRPELDEWRHWLDLAADNGVPAAESLKAKVLLNEYQMTQYSLNPSPTTHVDPTAPAKVHELALNALQSGDPQVLWQMADLVGVDHPQQLLTGDAALVPLAWHLLACERGFDCSANAEWLRGACNQGATCAPGETGQQLLEQTAVGLGGNWEDVKRLAREIGATVDTKDEAKLPSYLWAKN